MNNTLPILEKGDSVSIISPSASVIDNPNGVELCAKGESAITSLGLNVSHGKNYLGKEYYKSGSVLQRVSDLEEAYKDRKIKAIFCTQGGDNSNELLPLLDWDIIRNNPKRLFGSSDITVLLNAIYTHTRQVSYHGIDVIWGLGMNAGEYTLDNIKNALFTNSLKYNHHPDYPEWKIVRSGVSNGVCIGGCLPSFCLLLGTDSDPIKSIDESFILIIESIGETFSRIESYIAQISQQPNFKKYCSGVIVGYFFLSKEELPENNRSVSDIVLEYTKGLSFPIIEIKELGHAVENIIFPIGGKINLTATDSKVDITNF